MVRVGAHVIRHWSRLQSVVSLSSGEAELYSLNKGGAEGLGIQQLAYDMGWILGVVLRTDASATKAMAMRRGSGKLKHVEVQELWLQQAVHSERLRVEKIPRASNASDLLTHHWTSAMKPMFQGLAVMWDPGVTFGA